MNSRTAPTRGLVIWGIVSLVFLAGCGSSASQHSGSQSGGTNPVPTINSLSPTSAAAGGAAFTLTVNGTNFLAASVVNFGGTARATTFVSAMQLTAAIPAAAIASVGTDPVTVNNPAPGGGTSNAMNFTITSSTNPIPTIAVLSPSGTAVGGPAFTLSVFGCSDCAEANFVASSVVRFNASDRPTTFVSGSQLTAQISASDIAAIGTAAVTVFTPAPGGGISNSLNFTIATGGVSPQSVAVDPTGKFAYVANSDSNNISMYTIDSTTGALTFFGLMPAGMAPDSVTVHPSGKFAYVANSLSNDVSMYSINPTTGTLTSIGPPVATADHWSRSVAVDPQGKFAYVANGGGDEPGATFSGSVAMFTIDAVSGALTSTGMVLAPCAPPPSPGSCAPISVAVHPSGKFAYVANEGGFTPTSISMFKIDATTGALTSIGLIAAGGRAISVTVDPSGKFAYVVDGEDNSGSLGVNVSMYTVDATTGALTSIGLIAAAAGTHPASVAVDPTSKFAYVANSGSNDVSMYSINPTTGTLTSIGTIAAGESPSSIAVHPSGKFAYVTSGPNNVYMYSIDAATGVLTLIGTIGT